MTLNTLVAALAMALFVGVLALVGFIAEHIPTVVAFFGVLVLVAMVVSREEGRR